LKKRKRFDTSLEEAQAIVSAGDLSVIYYFADNVFTFLEPADQGQVTLVADRSRSNYMTIENAVNLVQNRIDLARAAATRSVATLEQDTAFPTLAERNIVYRRALLTALQSWQEPALTLDSVPASAQTQDEGGFTYNAFAQSSPGMIVQFAIFGLINSSMVLVLEKKNRSLHRMLVAPLSAGQVIGGHVVGMFLLTFFQEILLVLVGQYIFGVNYLLAPLATLLMMVALALWSASMGLLIGVISKTEEHVIMYSLIAMFVLAALGGAWFPLEMTGATFARIGHLLPSAWAMDGLQNVVIRGLGIQSVLLPAAVLLAYGGILFALAILRFRKSTAE